MRTRRRTARGTVCITVTVTAAAAATHPSFQVHSADSESQCDADLSSASGPSHHSPGHCCVHAVPLAVRAATRSKRLSKMLRLVQNKRFTFEIDSESPY